MHTFTDDELIRLFKKEGNTEAVGILYERYVELVYGVCLKYLNNPESAKDAVMQIFEELLTKLRKHEIEYFRGWLYRLSKNYCLMQLRKPAYKKNTEFLTHHVQNEEILHLNTVMEQEENLKMMEFCLEQLPQKQKEAIVLFYLKEKCYHEIADLMNEPWNSVRSLIQNGRRNLKICMEKRGVTYPQKQSNT
ncbi:MAG: sigma-70 family RNA polymerase sigma factor [Chitinophagaceae bacterium]|nr:sigma-70 family RNA polymerase sigma factor [Chitinophagaceae bacterium]